MKEKNQITNLFQNFINTLNLVFLDDFYKEKDGLKKVKVIVDKWYHDFQTENTLIKINPKEIKFIDLEVTDFFDKYIEIEDASRNYTEILSFNLSQLEKYWENEIKEQEK